MAALVAALGAINLQPVVQVVNQAWGWARVQAGAGIVFLAALPRDCTRATTHAALVCSGQIPEYFMTPGFPPISLAWGWLFLGALLGAALSVLVLMWMGMLRREPGIAALAALAQPGGPPGLVMPQDRARDDIVAYLLAGRGAALRELATAAGLTEVEFLHSVVGGRQLRQPQNAQIHQHHRIPGTNIMVQSSGSS